MAMALWAGPVVAEVEFLGSYVWTMPDPAFGGWSGIEVGADGSNFLAISDRAHIVEGRLVRDGAVIVAVEAGAILPLADGSGGTITGPRADAEGLAVDADGTRYLSFEGRDPRVRVETGPDGVPVALPRNPAFDRYPPNASLEALAVGPDGAIWVIPERSGRLDRPFPAHRLLGGVWDVPFVIPRVGAFLVSGADIGPDGMLYILERDFTGIGFRSRVRRFALDGSGGEVLIETRTGLHDNLEGISVWEDAQGIRITMISDDNFRFFQRTEIVEYRLTE